MPNPARADDRLRERRDDELGGDAMWVILAEPDDTLALCVHAELARRHGASAALLASSAELLCSRHFSYRDGGLGPATSRLELAAGRTLDSSATRAVWCRLRAPVLPQFAGAHPDDAEYAHLEAFAVLLAWLASLPCPLLVPPDPQCLAGTPIGRWELARAAAAAGLEPRRTCTTTSARRRSPPQQALWLTPEPPEVRAIGLAGNRALALPVATTRQGVGSSPALCEERLRPPFAVAVVIGEEVRGDAPAELASALRRLARELRAPLLEVRLGRAAETGATANESARPWRVADATRFATLLRGDVIEALADHLELLAAARGSQPAAGAAAGSGLPLRPEQVPE